MTYTKAEPIKGYCKSKQVMCELANELGYCKITACAYPSSFPKIYTVTERTIPIEWCSRGRKERIMRLIDADALIEKFSDLRAMYSCFDEEEKFYYTMYSSIINLIEHEPMIDAEEREE